MSENFVFVGPSLPVAEAAALLPGATILPPVAHGDLLRLDAAPGDRVLIVDGLFLHTAPVRHRELLLLLDRGVVVAGGSSMGALRAAELWPFGMRGVGAVFTLYRDGVVTGDDEVAIVHGPAEEGYRPLSEPLVNIRIAVRTATTAGVLDPAQAATVLELARSLPFRARSYRALRAAGQGTAASATVERFVAWAGEHAIDAKAADARQLLSMAARDDAALRPHGAGDEPIRNLHTRHLDSWRVRYAGRPAMDRYVTDADTIATIMLCHPDFPGEQRQRVLAELAGVGPGDPAAADRAVQQAKQRGLAGEVGTGSSWLAAAEVALPEPERLARALTRAFGTCSYRGMGPATLPPSLATEEILGAAREYRAVAGGLNDELPAVDPHRPQRRLRFRAPVIERTFAQLWGCSPAEFPAAVWDHGFASRQSFWLAAEPLVASLKTFGPPELPAPAAPARPGANDVR